MTGKPLTPAEQIAGYLKLTSAHFYLNSRHDENLQLVLRKQIASEMSSKTLHAAQDLIDCMTRHFIWQVAA